MQSWLKCFTRVFIFLKYWLHLLKMLLDWYISRYCDLSLGNNLYSNVLKLRKLSFMSFLVWTREFFLWTVCYALAAVKIIWTLLGIQQPSIYPPENTSLSRLAGIPWCDLPKGEGERDWKNKQKQKNNLSLQSISAEGETKKKLWLVGRWEVGRRCKFCNHMNIWAIHLQCCPCFYLSYVFSTSRCQKCEEVWFEHSWRCGKFQLCFQHQNTFSKWSCNALNCI